MTDRIRAFLSQLGRAGLRPEIQTCLAIGEMVKDGEITEEEAFEMLDRVFGIVRST